MGIFHVSPHHRCRPYGRNPEKTRCAFFHQNDGAQHIHCGNGGGLVLFIPQNKIRIDHGFQQSHAFLIYDRQSSDPFLCRNRVVGDFDDDAVEYQLKVTIYFEHSDLRKEYALETVVPMRRDDGDLKV